MEESKRNWGNMIASLLFLLIGIGVTIGALKLKVGTPMRPQPGFFPFVAGVIVIGLSSVLMIEGWLGRGKRAEPFGEIWRPACLVAGIIVYVVILDPLGFALATVFISVVILRILGVKSLRVIGVSSLALSFGTYFLFARLLGVELPAGVLEGIWIF